MRTEPLMNLQYQESRGVMLPNIQISENQNMDNLPVGKFGKQWKEYMMEKHSHRLSQLIAEGKINEMILQVDEEAEAEKEKLILNLLEVQPMPEEELTMERIQHMNQITMLAEETVMEEVVMRIR